MANIHWRGGAQPISQVTTATPANVEAGDIFSLTINGKTVSFTATEATVAGVTAGLAAAIAAETSPEFAEITASDESTHLSLASAVPGVPFTVAGAAENGGGNDTQTLTIAEVTAAAGPNHWNVAENWSSGTVPADDDVVFVEDTSVSILYGLEQSSVVLAGLHIAASFSGEIGLARVNAAGYSEYRPRFLEIGASQVTIGAGQGPGSGRIQLDTGAGATTLSVFATGAPAELDLPAVLWRGNHADNELNVFAGEVGAAIAGGETATLAFLRQTGGRVRCGVGAALDSVELSGSGIMELASAAATVKQSGGELIFLGSGGIGALTLSGGRLAYQSSGTVGAATLSGPAALLDFSADLRGRTVSACTLLAGGILDPHETVTFTNGVQPGKELRTG